MMNPYTQYFFIMDIEITKTVAVYATFTNTNAATFTWNPLSSGNDYNAVQFIPDEAIVKQITYEAANATSGNYTVFCDNLGGYCGSFIIPSSTQLEIKVPMRAKSPMGSMTFVVKKVVGGALATATDLANSIILTIQFNKFMIKPTFAEGSSAAYSVTKKA